MNNEQCEPRYKRSLKHQYKKNVLCQDKLPEDVNELYENDRHNTNLTCDVSTQVAFKINDGVYFNFECTFDNNNAMTQISGPSLVEYCNIKKIDQSCDPEYLLFDRSFYSFISIKNELQLKDLTGTTFQVFYLLLNFLSDSSYYSFDKENRLLIFLIKIKLGITYSAISQY